MLLFAVLFLCCMHLDSGLWFGTECTERNDRLRGYKVVPCTWDYAQLDALQSHRFADHLSVPTYSWTVYVVSYKFYIVSLLSWSQPVRCYLNRFDTLRPLSIYFLIFSPFYFSLSFIGFTYFLLLSITSLSTRIVPLRFQAGGRRRRPNLGLVFTALHWMQARFSDEISVCPSWV